MSGGFDPENLGEMLAQVQKGLANFGDVNGALDVEGSAGGGAVRVHVSGELEFSAIEIDPAVVDRDAVDMLEDLILAALRDAMGKFAAASKAQMSDVFSSALSGMFGLSDPGDPGAEPEEGDEH